MKNNTKKKILSEFQEKFCFKEWYNEDLFAWQVRSTHGGTEEIEQFLSNSLDEYGEAVLELAREHFEFAPHVCEEEIKAKLKKNG